MAELGNKSQVRYIKLVIILAWTSIVLIPPLVFIFNGGVTRFAYMSTAFPFFGLVAISLIWSQIMLGAFMRPLERLYPNILKIHIIQGLTAFLFAFIHPSLRILSLPRMSQMDYFKFKIDFITPEKAYFVYFGEAALLLLVLGVLAGLLRNWPPIKKYWHWIHLVNYGVFFAAFIHSWNLGSDVQTSPILKAIWIFYITTVAIALVYRRVYSVKKYGLLATTS